jgi:predicted nucleic acid-binding protein
MLLLDTDILVNTLRAYLPAIRWLAAQDKADIGIPGFVVLELLNGYRNRREMRLIERHLAPYRVYWPSAGDCDRALAVFARLSLTHRVGVIDVLIAESAIGLGIPLCTFNVRHFRAIPGLVTEQPYQR